MYKCLPDTSLGPSQCVQRLSDNAFIPFSTANTDYQQFKKDIENGAELQDSEGVVMTPEAAKAFIQTLPQESKMAKFPDLTGDGEVTKADVLKGRGVFKKGGKVGEKWIQKAIKKPGALKKSLGVKEGQKIPAKKLAAAAKAPGKLGQRARLAKTLQKMK